MKKRFLVVLFLVFCACAQTAFAGTFYLHDHEAYWWFVQEKPAFSVVIPADAERYVQKNYFGQQLLEMTWQDGKIMMEVANVSHQDIQTVRKSVEERWKPLINNVTIISNREI